MPNLAHRAILVVRPRVYHDGDAAWSTRLIFSAGMFSPLAARIAVRSRGLPSGSPPPPFAAIVISLIRRVNVLPRLASSAPFLCLIVAHFEWPDMGTSVSLEMPARPAIHHRFMRPPLRVYHRADCP